MSFTSKVKPPFKPFDSWPEDAKAHFDEGLQNFSLRHPEVVGGRTDEEFRSYVLAYPEVVREIFGDASGLLAKVANNHDINSSRGDGRAEQPYMQPSGSDPSIEDRYPPKKPHPGRG